MVESDSHTSNEANEQEKRRDRNYKGLQAHDRRRDEEIGQGGNMCSVNYFGFINSACLIRLSCFPPPHGCDSSVISSHGSSAPLALYTLFYPNDTTQGSQNFPGCAQTASPNFFVWTCATQPQSGK